MSAVAGGTKTRSESLDSATSAASSSELTANTVADLCRCASSPCTITIVGAEADSISGRKASSSRAFTRRITRCGRLTSFWRHFAQELADLNRRVWGAGSCGRAALKAALSQTITTSSARSSEMVEGVRECDASDDAAKSAPVRGAPVAAVLAVVDADAPLAIRRWVLLIPRAARPAEP